VLKWRRTEGDWGVGMEAWVEVEAGRSRARKVFRVRTERLCGLTPWRAAEVVADD